MPAGTASSDSRGSDVTGPPAHKTASVNSNSVSAHRPRHPYHPARNPASRSLATGNTAIQEPTATALVSVSLVGNAKMIRRWPPHCQQHTDNRVKTQVSRNMRAALNLTLCDWCCLWFNNP